MGGATKSDVLREFKRLVLNHRDNFTITYTGIQNQHPLTLNAPEKSTTSILSRYEL